MERGCQQNNSLADGCAPQGQTCKGWAFFAIFTAMLTICRTLPLAFKDVRVVKVVLVSAATEGGDASRLVACCAAWDAYATLQPPQP